MPLGFPGHPEVFQLGMGQAGLYLFRQRFTPKAVGQQLLSLLEQSMDARRSRS